MNVQTHAIVISIKGRYFCRIQKGRVLTAWTLAGAMFFRHQLAEDLKEVLWYLDQKKKKYTLEIVRLDRKLYEDGK